MKIVTNKKAILRIPIEHSEILSKGLLIKILIIYYIKSPRNASIKEEIPSRELLNFMGQNEEILERVDTDRNITKKCNNVVVRYLNHYILLFRAGNI